MNCKSELAEEIEVEILVATVFMLMTRYADQQEKQLVRPIIEHFDWLVNHPDLVNSQLKKTCSRLSNCWKSIQTKKQIGIQTTNSEKFLH